MAYTKTPEIDTHNRFRIPVRGNQTFTANTRTYQYNAGLRYVNCYPVINESKTKEPKVTLMKVPRLLYKIWQFPTDEPGITDFDYDTGVFVHTSYIYLASPSGTSGPTISILENQPTYTFLSIQKVIDYSGAGDIILMGLVREIASGDVYPYTYNKSQDLFEVGADALSVAGTDLYVDADYVADGYVGDYNTIAIVRDLFVDGYHVVATKSAVGGANRVYTSVAGLYNDFSTATDFFVPEIDPDDIVDVQKHKNYIVIIGTNTIEFFYNAAEELGSPFLRQQNLTIRLGAAQNISFNNGLVSIALGDDIYFFANSGNGANSIYRIRDFKEEKISDDYIDYVLNSEKGLIRDIDPSTAKLGLVDIMGNIQLVVEFRNMSSNDVTATFVYNDRDAIWWEWSESNAFGLTSTTKGIASNLTGKPFFISAQLLGIDGFAQYSVSAFEVQ